MRKIILLFFILHLILPLQSQQINTSGGSVQSETYAAEWIIGGSLFDNSLFNSGESVSMLFPDSANIGLIDVYPTATNDYLTIKRKTEFNAKINYLIFNSLGIAVMSGSMNDITPFYLAVNQIPAGHYNLTFYSPDDKTFRVTIKFIKL